MTTESYRDKYDNPEKTAEAFRSDLIYANVVTGLYRPREEDYSPDFKASRGNGLVILLALLIVTLLMAMFIPAMLEAKDLTLTQEINKARVKPLTEDKVLIKYALIRCKAMKTWSHDGFLDIAYDVMYVYGRNGIITRYKDVGENLATGFNTAGSTMQAWMNSPMHKANIEDPRYTRIGIAACRNVLGTTTVALFGGK